MTTSRPALRVVGSSDEPAMRARVKQGRYSDPIEIDGLYYRIRFFDRPTTGPLPDGALRLKAYGEQGELLPGEFRLEPYK